MDGKSIWALEDGDYSDYHVIGVFSSKKNAERIRKVVGGHISEWLLDPAIEALNQGLTMWRVVMLRNGNTESVKGTDVASYDLAGRSWLWSRSTAPAYVHQNLPDVLVATVWAKDTEHAVKITNEIRTKMIAEGQWT